MTTTLTTNFSIPIPPLDSGGTTDGYATLMQTADTAILNASGKGAWTDYSATSTIVGWSSFTTKLIKYKKVGNIVFLVFNLTGDSNSVSVTFTVPYAPIASISLASLVVWDNSSSQTLPGAVSFAAGLTTVTLYKTAASGAWTASGLKSASGRFFYEVA